MSIPTGVKLLIYESERSIYFVNEARTPENGARGRYEVSGHFEVANLAISRGALDITRTGAKHWRAADCLGPE